MNLLLIISVALLIVILGTGVLIKLQTRRAVKKMDGLDDVKIVPGKKERNLIYEEDEYEYEELYHDELPEEEK